MQMGDSMDLNDINMKIEGSGQAIIFLHGWGGSMKLMDPLYDSFKNQYQVCNLDLPGFGKSKEPDNAYTIYDYVKVIREIVKKYQLIDPIFIAHSFGARIAFIYASVYPCSYLIITGGAGIKPKRTFDYYLKVYTYKLLKWFKIENQFGSTDYQNASMMMKKILVNVVNENIEETIKKIDCPILLVWGEKDQDTPLYMAEKIKNLNNKCSLIVFEEEDHYAYYHQIHRFIAICEYALEAIK